MTTYQIGGRFVCLDKYGWPIETIKGRHITNLIRILLHTRKIVRGPLVYEVHADPSTGTEVKP